MIALFIFLLIHSSAVAQLNSEKLDYEDVEAVVLLDKNEFEVLNENKAKFRKHCIIQINQDGGKKYGHIAISENKFIKIKTMSAKTIDRDGEIVEELKEKHLKKYPFSAGYILYDDTNYKWCELAYNFLPYKIEYSYELEMSSLFFWPDWNPQRDIPVLESSYKLIIDNSIKFNTYSIGNNLEP
ncbi:MAG: DUF3857 domain-containing protein, partial [Nitrosopumilaceae archaeon]|nr:DUF3857 domain-containing protein [Nitrosopumilaceae archaeon]